MAILVCLVLLLMHEDRFFSCSLIYSFKTGTRFKQATSFGWHRLYLSGKLRMNDERCFQTRSSFNWLHKLLSSLYLQVCSTRKDPVEIPALQGCQQESAVELIDTCKCWIAQFLNQIPVFVTANYDLNRVVQIKEMEHFLACHSTSLEEAFVLFAFLFPWMRWHSIFKWIGSSAVTCLWKLLDTYHSCYLSLLGLVNQFGSNQTNFKIYQHDQVY